MNLEISKQRKIEQIFRFIEVTGLEQEPTFLAV